MFTNGKKTFKMFENETDINFDDDVVSSSFVKTSERRSTKRSSSENELEDNKRCKILRQTSSLNSINNNGTVRVRKFPGPAGILPETAAEIFEQSYELITPSQLPCTQTGSNCNEDSWCETIKEFPRTLLETFNIKWVKKKASLKQLENHKAPFLIAYINSIEFLEEKIPTINVVLKDNTGELNGMILHSLYEKYSKDIIVGSVLVLKNFSVLTTNDYHLITITSNNLLTIYSNSSKIVVQNFKLEELVNCTSKTETTESVANKNIFDDVGFDEEFDIPDNFEETALKTEEDKNVSNIFDGMDTSVLFDDF